MVGALLVLQRRSGIWQRLGVWVEGCGPHLHSANSLGPEPHICFTLLLLGWSWGAPGFGRILWARNSLSSHEPWP